MRPRKSPAEFKTRDGRVAVLRPLSMTDLSATVRFAKTLVRERKVNPDLGIISLDGRVTRTGERRFLQKNVTGLKRKEQVSVAAFVEGRLVGNCGVTRRKPYDVRHTGLLGIAILDGYRGIGLGERMVRNALEESRRIGIWLVELQVFETNAAARRLYDKTGFKVAGVVPRKMKRGDRLFNEVHMYADLRGTDKSPTQAGV